MLQRWQLRQLQSVSLGNKIMRSERKIREWYMHYGGRVYVSVSGRDSAVMLDLVRKMYPGIPAVFCDTGLEYPEVREFIKGLDDVTWLKPKLSFAETIKKYGFPIVSKEVSQYIHEYRHTKSEKLRQKRLHGAGDRFRSGKIPLKWRYLLEAPFEICHKCCDVMKKRPAASYEKSTGRVPFIGTLAEDSMARSRAYMRYTCNAYGLGRPRSAPLSLWTHADILEYVERENIRVPACYSQGWEHTGCMFCMFGLHLEDEPNRFQRMRGTHPRIYKYCMGKLGLRDVLRWWGVPFE